MFFSRIISFATVVASFALLSHARPMHHARASVAIVSTPNTSSMSEMMQFQKDITIYSENITKAATTGKDPEEEIKKLSDCFAKVDMSGMILSVDQQKEFAGIVSSAITATIDSCHQVGAKHNFMKYYAKWTDLDFSMHSFMQKCAGISFSMYKDSLIRQVAGKSTAVKCHDMKMRHLVNDFRGMGISYE